MTGPAGTPRVDPAEAADALFGRAISLLAGGAAPEGAPSVGASDSERVTATLAPDGTVRSLELDPRLQRGTPAALAGEIVEAVNRAVDARPPASASRQDRADQLRRLKEDSLVQARALRVALEDELSRLVDEGSGS